MTRQYFEKLPDVRLIASDMDGTLLDEKSNVPEEFWPLLEKMDERGILFVPASGRQYATLAEIFPPEHLGFIAENGNVVMLREKEVFAAALDRPVVEEVVTTLRNLKDRDAGAVLCAKDCAYIERTDEPFVAECAKYYTNLEIVPDILAVDDKYAKIALYDFESSGEIYPHFERFADDYLVLRSSPHWVDISQPGIDKGTGLAMLQEAVGVTPAETVIFGDFHNDLPMFAEADHAFAVENGHADVREAATRVIPSNRDGGVVEVLRELLRD